MIRLLCGVVVASLVGCAESVPEAVSTTRITASGAWDGAHAELFTVPSKGGRLEGEILWPSKIQAGPPPLVILVNGTTPDGNTALARSLAESGVATLRYSDVGAIDEEIVSASVKVLRHDARVGRIVLLASEDDPRAANVDVHLVLPSGATSNDVIAGLASRKLR